MHKRHAYISRYSSMSSFVFFFFFFALFVLFLAARCSIQGSWGLHSNIVHFQFSRSATSCTRTLTHTSTGYYSFDALWCYLLCASSKTLPVRYFQKKKNVFTNFLFIFFSSFSNALLFFFLIWFGSVRRWELVLSFAVWVDVTQRTYGVRVFVFFFSLSQFNCIFVSSCRQTIQTIPYHLSSDSRVHSIVWKMCAVKMMTNAHHSCYTHTQKHRHTMATLTIFIVLCTVLNRSTQRCFYSYLFLLFFLSFVFLRFCSSAYHLCSIF